MKILVTGGAGFIGSHLCDALLDQGHKVVALDNLSLGMTRNIAHLVERDDFQFIEEDILNTTKFENVVASGDFECVFHMAANSDIARSHKSPQVDLNNTFLTTFNVLEAMRKSGVTKIVFASTSAIYGEAPGKIHEDYGPLQPISHYGAGKLSSEAFITSFAANYGIQAWITRFPNVVGPRSTHGAIFDFVARLKKNPNELTVLGNGTQEKPYLNVTNLVEAILLVWRKADRPVNVFNVGTATLTTVANIARIVVEEAGLSATISYTGGDRGWIGDVPKFEYDTSAVESLGWKASMSSDEAVRIAAKAVWSEAR